MSLYFAQYCIHFEKFYYILCDVYSVVYVCVQKNLLNCVYDNKASGLILTFAQVFLIEATCSLGMWDFRNSTGNSMPATHCGAGSVDLQSKVHCIKCHTASVHLNLRLSLKLALKGAKFIFMQVNLLKFPFLLSSNVTCICPHICF